VGHLIHLRTKFCPHVQKWPFLAQKGSILSKKHYKKGDLVRNRYNAEGNRGMIIDVNSANTYCLVYWFKTEISCFEMAIDLSPV